MQENKKIPLFILIAFIALLSISFYVGGRYTAKNMQILYISQAEILAIEKARIANEPASDRQLFFGKPERAINYIEQAQDRISRNGLVLLTDSKIYGRNVQSISKEVHGEIIRNLTHPSDEGKRR